MSATPDSPALLGAEFSEEAARRLCLVRAVETSAVDAALWSPEDAAWAGRAASEALDDSASAAAWLADRARLACERLLPRRTSLARAFARRTWSLRWAALAALLGLFCGIAADSLGVTQHINLLAAPLWAVIAWNLAVYGWIAWQALGRSGEGFSAGVLRRGVQRWFGGRAASASAGALTQAATPEQRFSALWAEASAPLAVARAACLLHVAALALALGLVAGLYGRALVLDYRVSWQSTLLEPDQVHAVLATLLAPAAALTGIAVPGVSALAEMRLGAAGTGMPTATAAPWLHLLAATLAWAVIVPRGLLALRAAWISWRRARRLPLATADAYALKLLRSRARAGRVRVQVLPHGFVPTAASTLGLRALLVAAFGEGCEPVMADSTAYGDEERAPSALTGLAWRIAWFDLAATPEAQAQGRFVEQLRRAGLSPLVSPVPLVMLVDEAGYRRRMGANSPRLGERRVAWRVLADAVQVGLACVDLQAPDQQAAAVAAIEASLQVQVQVQVPTSASR